MGDYIFLGINRIQYVSLSNIYLTKLHFPLSGLYISFKAQTKMEICVLNLHGGVKILAPVLEEGGVSRQGSVRTVS